MPAHYKALTPKHLEVLDLYRGGPDDVRGNGTECYSRVFPKANRKSCSDRWYKLSNSPLAIEYLNKKVEEISQKADVTQERILNETACSAFLDPIGMFDEGGNMLPINQMPEHVRRAIASFKVRRLTQKGSPEEQESPIQESIIEVRMVDKKGTLELLGKYLKMWTDKIEQDGPPSVVIKNYTGVTGS